MNKEKNNKLIFLFILSVSFIAVSLTTVLLTYYYSKIPFQVLGDFCGEIIGKFPENKQEIMEILKKQVPYTAITTDENVLASFGYQRSDFFTVNARILLIAGICFVIGSAMTFCIFWHWHKKSVNRINMLTTYLEKINTNGQGLLLDTSDDEFSKLQDEIYKTITTLYQTRDEALMAKKNFADNLSNIAHQLKTPITAISLSAQMMKKSPSSDYPVQIGRQLNRLTHLEEALLLLSRIDAGTLSMKRTVVDVFTLLTLASDNLQELFSKAGVLVYIPEADETNIFVDLDWTMEAMMNLLKNCMEHTPSGGTVHCSYEKNPLYVQIQIWDEGQGFAKEDLPCLFERFYRGKNEKNDGIGIGLSLAKAIIEMQDGIISTFNLPSGGACFEIRFYSH